MNDRRLSPGQWFAAAAVGIAFGLTACSAPHTLTADPEQPTEATTGEVAYLAAAEHRLDLALGVRGSFDADPSLKDAALEVARLTCDILSDGATEADIFAALDVDPSIADVARYWITAASVYVC